MAPYTGQAARYVVHTVGPVWNGGSGGEPDLLRSAHRNSLELSSRHGARTIAFPSISTGFARQDPSFAEIRFLLFSDQNLKVYEKALTGAEPSPGTPDHGIVSQALDLLHIYCAN